MKILNYLLIIILSCLASSAFAGDGHSHAERGHTPHGGIVKPFANSKGLSGYLELKLHGDKGDLELWLADWRKRQPFDIDLNSSVKVTFPEMKKSVTLIVRNKQKNEDENGISHIRKGKTNYFIFPGKAGESAKFLKGEEFSSIVVVSFMVNGEHYSSDPFILTPHSH